MSDTRTGLAARLRWWFQKLPTSSGASTTSPTVQGPRVKQPDSQAATQIPNLRAQIRMLEEENYKLHSTQASQEESVRLAQESAFRRLKESTHTAEADEVVEEKLNILEREIKSWAKRYARSSEEPLPPPLETHSTDIFKRLLASVSGVSDELAGMLASPCSDQKLLNRILTAMTSAAIYGRVAEQPFFFMPFRRRCENSAQSQDVLEFQDKGADLELSKLYRESLRSDEQAACSWRAYTLRLLDPRYQPDAPREHAESEKQTRQDTARARTGAYRYIAVQILKFEIAPLVYCSQEQESQMLDQLERLVKKCDEIFAPLQVQKRRIILHFQNELASFDVGSHYMEAHPKHNNDPNSRIQGQRITLVTHPMVGFVDYEGQGSCELRVLKRAIVTAELKDPDAMEE